METKPPLAAKVAPIQEASPVERASSRVTLPAASEEMIISVIFHHIGIQQYMGIFRLADQTRITQEWILAINDLIKRKEFP